MFMFYCISVLNLNFVFLFLIIIPLVCDKLLNFQHFAIFFFSKTSHQGDNAYGYWCSCFIGFESKFEYLCVYMSTNTIFMSQVINFQHFHFFSQIKATYTYMEVNTEAYKSKFVISVIYCEEHQIFHRKYCAVCLYV